MAMKIGEVKNPITSSGGNILNPWDWVSRIMFVAWIGIIFAAGSKLLNTADKYIPGNNTPTGMQNVTASAVTGESLVVYYGGITMVTFNKSNFFLGNWGASDLISAATVSLIKDEWKIVGEQVIPADQLVGLGFGGYATQDAAPGRLYVKFMDNSNTPVAIKGQFRIEIQSSNDLPLGGRPVLIDYDLATTALGATNRTERLPLPYNNIMLSKDKKYVFKVKNTADTAQTLSRANSTVELDITRQLV